MVLAGAACGAGRAAEAELVDSINPMIGAITLGGYGGHGLGKTFPGAATPFGMVQLSPDTITGGDNGCGYSAHHETIEGVSFTHMSGVGWYGDLGNFQVMAATGARALDRERAKSEYSHDRERASAGYYSVELKRYGIRTELTAAPRAGLIRCRASRRNLWNCGCCARSRRTRLWRLTCAVCRCATMRPHKS
jgi:putative alpha-1,2-mannosidase